MTQSSDPQSSDSQPTDARSAMQALLLELAKALVDSTSQVRVESFDDEGTTVLRLQVAPSDIGKVIGKQGRTARSLRTILSAASMKYHQRFALDIVEAEGGPEDDNRGNRRTTRDDADDFDRD